MTLHIPRFLVLAACLILASCDSSGAPAGEDASSFPDPADAGSSVESCSFQNCDGCCDGYTCVSVVSESACGQPGAACQSCSIGDSCVAGSCVAANDCQDCEGCCFEDSVCLEGNTRNACGADGESCVACPQGQGCMSNGQCEDIACDASNCANGCCTANGECITNAQQNLSACGSGGMACEVCDGDALSCTLGTCVLDQPCLDFCDQGCCTPQGQCIVFADQDAATCGAAQTCSPCDADLSCLEGGCTADPVWAVVVKSVIINDTNSDGEAWDQTLFSDPLPDAYVMGALADDTFLDWATSTIDNTLTPNWNETKGSYLQSELLTQGLLINIRDSDGLGVFELIGACVVHPTEGDLLGGDVTKALCGSSMNLTLDYVLQ